MSYFEPIIKTGENFSIRPEDIRPASYASVQEDNKILQSFAETAKELKKIAPKANEFLYFSAIMMHASEASLLDENGKLRKNADGSDATVKWEKNGESWKWISSNPDIKPYKNANCFIAGTKILLEDGSVKNIEDIQIGDSVITHKNRSRKVTKLFVTEYNNDLLEFTIRNCRKIVCTSEHPFYQLKLDPGFKSKDKSLRQRDILKFANYKKEYIFTEAKNLKKHDILLGPKCNKYVKSDITPDKARLLGLFAAEGCYGKKYNKKQSLRFTFSFKEKNTLCDYVKNLFEKEFENCSVKISSREKCGICELTVTCKGICDYFYKHIGEYSNKKTLSKEIVFGTKEVKENFVLGWLEGDGHVSKIGQIIGITTSDNLASQLKLILNSLEIATSIRHVKLDSFNVINKNYPAYKTNGHYRIEINPKCGLKLIQKSKKLYKEKKTKDINQINFVDNYSIHTIRNINKIPFSGKVYNFEVEEDNSYVANDILVHNCDIFPEEELIKAHKNWVGKPLCIDHKSSSVDHIRGIIVDTYYDFPLKRVIALCALDQVNYPDLARKVKTGYSTDVSMGTAVEKAICYDCGKVARTEPEFCDHMRNKTCYGEINIGLKPIELSIVVNGADQRAKIRHIIASLNTYIKKKAFDPKKALEGEKIDVALVESVLKKMTDLQKEIDSLELSDERKKELGDILQKVERDVQELGKRESEEVREYEQEVQNQNQTQEKESAFVIQSLVKNIDKLQCSIERIEEKMADKKAYWQGTEQPKPGQLQYPKEEGPDVTRDKYDGHMRNPQDMGPVNGLFPGDEAKKKELQRAAQDQQERRLRREAALKRAKEQSKKAYWQGTDEPTPGKPKYPKEEADKLREEDKHFYGAPPFPGVGKVDGLYGDDLKKKEMLHRANTKLKGKFVAAVNSDGTENKSQSRWDVYAQVENKDKLVFSATVNQLTNGKVDALYSQVHDQKFGKHLLATIRSEGFDKAAQIFKGAQAAPAAPQMPQLDLGAPPSGGQPGMTDPMGGMGNVPGMDAGGTGDPKQKIPELLDQAENTIRDLREGFNALQGESGNELAEMQNMAPPAEAPVMAEMFDMRGKLVRGIKMAMLQTGKKLKKNIDELKLAKEIYSESKLTKEQSAYLSSLTKAATEKTEKLLAEAKDEMKSFIMLAEGTKHLQRKASAYARMNKKAQNIDASTYDAFSPEAQFGIDNSSKPTGAGYTDKSKPSPVAPSAKKPSGPKGLPKLGPNATYDELYRARGKGRQQFDQTLQQVSANPGSLSGPKAPKAAPGTIEISDPGHYVAPQDQNAVRRQTGTSGAPQPDWSLPPDYEFTPDYNSADDVDLDDENDACKINDKGELTGDTPEEVGKAHKAMKSASEEFDLTTKEGRAAKRMKLAEKGIQWSEWLSKSNPKGVTPEMDRKPGGDLAKIEVPSETHTEMMKMVDLHKTTPPKVKKAAENIQRAVKEGKIAADEVEGLVAHGVDAEAVKYWKQYYGQAKDGGSEFATELVKEYEKNKKAEETETSQVKFARAYEMAHELALRGLVENTPKEIRRQAEDIMKWNDEAFESHKNVIARMPIKEASNSLPNVGASESVLGISSFASLAKDAAPVTLVNQFEQALLSRQAKR